MSSKLNSFSPVIASSCDPKDLRRSEGVVLRMRIAVIAEDTERKRQQFEVMTQVVNAHRGLMRTQTELHLGQPMLLKNLQNHSAKACRVVGIDDTADRDFAVAFEFATRNPKSWPVAFPPEDCIAVPV